MADSQTRVSHSENHKSENPVLDSPGVQNARINETQRKIDMWWQRNRHRVAIVGLLTTLMTRLRCAAMFRRKLALPHRGLCDHRRSRAIRRGP